MPEWFSGLGGAKLEHLRRQRSRRRSIRGAAERLPVWPARALMLQPADPLGGDRWETFAMLLSVTEHFTKTARHSSFYLACGPETGPLIIFDHG